MSFDVGNTMAPGMTALPSSGSQAGCAETAETQRTKRRSIMKKRKNDNDVADQTFRAVATVCYCIQYSPPGTVKL